MKQILVGIFLTTAACVPSTQTYLFKDGATVARADADIFDCKVEATQAVPQNTQLRSSPAYRTPLVTRCTEKRCYTTGGDLIGGNTYSYDANAGLRREYLARCLASKGYSATTLPVCPTDAQIRSDILGALGGELREPREGACIKPVSSRIGNLVYPGEIAAP